MTDHAGPQYSECPQGTFVARFGFCKTKKESVEGEKYEANVVGNGSSQIRGRI